MNLIICESADHLARLASKWTADNVARFRANSIFLPAGQTPIDLYNLWENEKPSFLNQVDLLQIDDVLAGERSGMFKSFFKSYLPSYQKRFCAIEDGDRMADLAILGLGLNGHVAFHEPGLPFDFFSGCVHLDNLTCDTLKIDKGSWGITYGAGAFYRSKAVLMIVKGKSKRKVLAELRDGRADLPASYLFSHANLTLLADREAAGDD